MILRNYDTAQVGALFAYGRKHSTIYNISCTPWQLHRLLKQRIALLWNYEKQCCAVVGDICSCVVKMKNLSNKQVYSNALKRLSM